MHKPIGLIVVTFITALVLPAQSLDTQSQDTQSQDTQLQDTANRSAPGSPATPASAAATALATATQPTESERVDEYLKNLMNPFSLFTTAARAGISQGLDTPREWGQGGEGYARRFASGFAQHIVYNTLLLGGSSLFHDDNRYFASGESGFGARASYAVESAVLARHYDSNGQPHRRLSFSRIGALAGAALISRLWQPKSTSGLGSAASNFGISLGVAGGFNVAREFVPGFPK